MICALLMERLAVKSMSSNAGRRVNCGLDAIPGLALLPVVGFGLPQGIEQFA
ncbi:MAG: hypothetical protein IPI06_10430 [Gammaproteobacteria bacterium]|nr:hypothetical protein [Gammaproteobacteria bacterium]